MNAGETAPSEVPVISLNTAPGAGEAWGASKLKVYAWALVELVVITNPLQISSALRVKALRAFGARIGRGVIFRPRTRVKYPWNLSIGNDCWIGEGVWFHNQDQMTIGSDVVVSQETFLTNGSHALRKDMALITKPVTIEDGAWLTTRCIILGGSVIGRSTVITPGTVVSGIVPANSVFGTSAPAVIRRRFTEDDAS